jgi:hypothetical protein
MDNLIPTTVNPALKSLLRCCRCEVIKGGMEQYLTPMGPTKLHVNPIFEISPLEPRYSGEHAQQRMAILQTHLSAKCY